MILPAVDVGGPWHRRVLVRARSLVVLHVPFQDASQAGGIKDDHVIEEHSRLTEPMNRSM
jgi:hypothetical protein